MSQFKNIAVVAHVDHGKTSLVDCLLKAAHVVDEHAVRAMDSQDIERERGITIMAKNTSFPWHDFQCQLIDTPGHADFSGEVERILSLVDAFLLIVDAVDGPMPQTRYVTEKALKKKLIPLVCINKCDRHDADPQKTYNAIFDLFITLGAQEEDMNFPVIYTSAQQNWSSLDPQNPQDGMDVLMDVIKQTVPDATGAGSDDLPAGVQIVALDYSAYTGTLGLGLVRGKGISVKQPNVIYRSNGQQQSARITHLYQAHGLSRQSVQEAERGAIVWLAGVDDLELGDVVGFADYPVKAHALDIEAPTLFTIFRVDDGPFAKEGKLLTSRQLRERLMHEARHNPALHVTESEAGDYWQVAGRGELHLSVLMETMRREGFSFCVGSPQPVIDHRSEGDFEPFESVWIDVLSPLSGDVIALLGTRLSTLQSFEEKSDGRVILHFVLPARGMLGVAHLLTRLTNGDAIIHRQLDGFAPVDKRVLRQRQQGALVSQHSGTATTYALWKLQDRGPMFIDPGTEVYPGMIVGWHTRSNDLVVNVIKNKQLTNIRASGTDEHMMLPPPVKWSLEDALVALIGDEWLEITPKAIRWRKQTGYRLT